MADRLWEFKTERLDQGTQLNMTSDRQIKYTKGIIQQIIMYGNITRKMTFAQLTTKFAI